MGMFDDITCYYPLPDGRTDLNPDGFQSKSLDCCLDRYVITREGRLILRAYDLEVIPDEEREKTWSPIFRRVNERDEVLPYHGLIRFYQCGPDGWGEYEAKFTDGLLVSITRVEDNIAGARAAGSAVDYDQDAA